MAADLRRVCGAATADQAAAELDGFEEKWAGKYASIAPAGRRAWQEVISFFAFDPAIPRSRDPQDHLHDECHGKPQPGDPQIHQDARFLPDR